VKPIIQSTNLYMATILPKFPR